jgi:protein-S-isoprenylcysteine O-methyltransferase Ste14
VAVTIILIAWAATGMYFIATALLTNRVKRREPIGQRLLDLVLFFSGWILLFSPVPLPGIKNLDFMPPRETLQIAGVVLTCLGLPLSIWSRVRLGRYFSGGVALKRDHGLIQAGPYRVVRHPIYSGLLLAAVGTALCVTRWSSLLGVVALVVCFE